MNAQGTDADTINLYPKTTLGNIDAFVGCFNELDWEALGRDIAADGCARSIHEHDELALIGEA